MKMNAEEVTQAIRKSIQDFNLEDDYHTIRTKCMGRCDDAPVALLAPDPLAMPRQSMPQPTRVRVDLQPASTEIYNPQAMWDIYQEAKLRNSDSKSQ